MLLKDLLDHFVQECRINIFDERWNKEDVYTYDEAIDEYFARWVKEWEYIYSSNTLCVTLS